MPDVIDIIHEHDCFMLTDGEVILGRIVAIEDDAISIQEEGRTGIRSIEKRSIAFAEKL